MFGKDDLIPLVVYEGDSIEATWYSARELFGRGARRAAGAVGAAPATDNVIVWRAGVPVHGPAFEKWLRDWHAEHNGPVVTVAVDGGAA